MRRSVLLLVIAAAAAGLAALWFALGNKPQENALRARTLATRVLAESLVKSGAGRQALVISNPFTRRPGVAKEIAATEEAGLRGLKEGFGSKLRMEAPVFPDLKPGVEQDPRVVAIDPESTTPLSYLVAGDSFDRLAKAHPDCDLIVSLIGLPAALEGVQCWQASGPPRFGLLLPDLRLIGNTEAVRAAVKSGKLAAFVLQKPGAPGAEAEFGSREAAEFEKRFLLVSAANIDQAIQAYPKLFPGN